MQMSIGLDRLKRFVCLLLIFVLLFCFFLCPRAHAVALEAATVAYAARSGRDAADSIMKILK